MDLTELMQNKECRALLKSVWGDKLNFVQADYQEVIFKEIQSETVSYVYGGFGEFGEEGMVDISLKAEQELNNKLCLK